MPAFVELVDLFAKSLYGMPESVPHRRRRRILRFAVAPLDIYLQWQKDYRLVAGPYFGSMC